MENRQLLEWMQSEVESRNVVDFPTELLRQITDKQAEMLEKEFGATTLMRLPESEIVFFEWLRKADPPVWRDLWGEDGADDIGNSPYVVGLALLREIRREDRGFPICDLMNNPNFYFTHRHILHEEAKPYVDALLQKVEKKAMLSPAEVFVLEIRRAPLDIWRFAYSYELTLDQVKSAIHELVAGGILQYTPTTDELSEFLEF